MSDKKNTSTILFVLCGLSLAGGITVLVRTLCVNSNEWGCGLATAFWGGILIMLSVMFLGLGIGFRYMFSKEKKKA